MSGNSHSASPLRMLFWESTARCNLSCLHCRRMVKDENTDGELTGKNFKRVLDSVATLGKPIVVFSGGEPLMRDDWPDLADYAASLGLPTALATNGTMIDSRQAQRISTRGFKRVAVSLDGADAQTHDAFRGTSGAFSQALKGIDALAGAPVKIPLQINCTVAAHNVDQLDDIYRQAESLGATALHLFMLVPVGCGLALAKSHQLSHARYEQALQWVARHQGSRLELKATCGPQYQRILAEQPAAKPPTRPPIRGCLAAVAIAFVSSTGEVFPCGYLPVSCGNVQLRSFADIWKNSEVLANLRNFSNLKGKCSRCEYKSICGGCRARALAATGDYLAEDPTCTYMPRQGK